MASIASIQAPHSYKEITGFPCSRVQPGRPSCTRVKAVAGNRDNLDHLQRVKHLHKRPNPLEPTGTWDRFPTKRTVQQMVDTMDRVIEDPFAYGQAWPFLSDRMGRDGYGGGRTPWAIKERQNDYKMRFDMPGMTKNNVKVWVEENMLVVKANKVPNNRESQVNSDQNSEEEWPFTSYGRYNTRIALPDNVEFEKIKAEVKDGVLYITIPKATTSSKVIDINVQ